MVIGFFAFFYNFSVVNIIAEKVNHSFPGKRKKISVVLRRLHDSLPGLENCIGVAGSLTACAAQLLVVPGHQYCHLEHFNLEHWLGHGYGWHGELVSVGVCRDWWLGGVVL